VSGVGLGPKPPVDETAAGLILDCHARVRTFSELAVKLATEAASDVELMEAAARVLRYFTQALPLHVADEEQSLAPRLRRFSPETIDALTTMEREHREHERLLAALIESWHRLQSDPGPCAVTADDARRLRQEMERHLSAEERLVVPALAQLPPDEQRGFIEELRQRRRRS
jgi:iron-sulfur cluster repair protein YtfE (RIC family)